MWLVLSHQEPQTQYKSEIKEKTLSRQESLDGLRISQKSAKTPLFTEFSDGLGGKSEKVRGTRKTDIKLTHQTREEQQDADKIQEEC